MSRSDRPSGFAGNSGSVDRRFAGGSGMLFLGKPHTIPHTKEEIGP
jgi:hypothetical protein